LRAAIFSLSLTQQRRRCLLTYFKVLVSGFSGEKVWSAILVGYFSLKQRENCQLIDFQIVLIMFQQMGAEKLPTLYFVN
jgi:hypothetical protein